MSSSAGFLFLPVTSYVIHWRNSTQQYDYPRFELSAGIVDRSDQCSVKWFVLKKRKWDLITLYYHQMNFTVACEHPLGIGDGSSWVPSIR